MTGAPASPSGSRPSDQANLRCPDALRFDPSRGDYQMWPFGLGIVATGTFSDFGGLGAMVICAVPDGFTRADGGTPLSAWNASMDAPGPKLVFTFCAAKDVRVLVSELESLAIAIEARQGGNEVPSRSDESAGPQDIAQPEVSS